MYLSSETLQTEVFIAAFNIRRLLDLVGNRNIFIVTNQIVADLYLKKFELTDFPICIISDGEKFKNIETTTHVIDFLIENDCKRTDFLLALGGGVVSDIAGFVAASYMRGMSWGVIPTTLMSQVDAAIGGKTAINYKNEKNLIGFFHQPRFIFLDIRTLLSQTDREFLAGIAEVIKYACIFDKEFFEYLEKSVEKVLARELDTLNYIINKSVSFKLKVVEEDTTDKGNRRLLNFGHSFAHAIESSTNYNKYLHGEAVAIGMCMAASYSLKLELLPKKDLLRINEIIKAYNLPQGALVDKILYYMKRDKKNSNKNMNLVLLTSIGKAKVYTESYLNLANMVAENG